jgi:hypothetical protein
VTVHGLPGLQQITYGQVNVVKQIGYVTFRERGWACGSLGLRLVSLGRGIHRL